MYAYITYIFDIQGRYFVYNPHIIMLSIFDTWIINPFVWNNISYISTNDTYLFLNTIYWVKGHVTDILQCRSATTNYLCILIA